MAIMEAIDTIEGTVVGWLWYHFDITNDVLYLRLTSSRNELVLGEETPEGYTLLRTEDGRVDGITIVNYWRHFGEGDLKQLTLDALRERVEYWSNEPLLAA